MQHFDFQEGYTMQHFDFHEGYTMQYFDFQEGYTMQHFDFQEGYTMHYLMVSNRVHNATACFENRYTLQRYILKLYTQFNSMFWS